MLITGVEARRVVKIGEPVRQPWPQMKKCGRGLLRHAAITIGRPGHYTLEETKHGPYAFDPVERRDKMHFGCARIAEADLNTRSDKRPQQTFRTIHVRSSPSPDHPRVNCGSLDLCVK